MYGYRNRGIFGYSGLLRDKGYEIGVLMDATPDML